MKRRLEEDHYRDGEEILQKTKKAIEQSTNSREVAQLTEEAKKGLKQAAQKLLEELSQDRRLEIEKASVENLSDESAIDQALQESKLDTQRKQVLTEYIRRLKERIREERERKKVAMTQLGFEEAELELYREYCTLEDEVRGEIKRQIQLLQRVLPLEYRSEDEGHFRSGRRIDRGKLTDWATTGDDRVFLRRHDIVDTQRIAMYETIIIDRSGSM